MDYYEMQYFCQRVEEIARMNASEKSLTIKNLIAKNFPTIRFNQSNLSMHDLFAEILPFWQDNAQIYYSNYRNKLVQV